MKSSGVGGWGTGGQAHPKRFDLLKILAKSLKTPVKIAPNVSWLQKNGAQGLQKNT